VAARLQPLENQGVGAGALRGARLGDIGDRHPHLGAAGAQRADDLWWRATEGEGDDRDGFLLQQPELVLPPVVIEPRHSELDAVALGVGPQPLQVGAQRQLVDLAVAGREQVHTERRGRDGPQLVAVIVEPLGGQVAAAQEPQAAGVADGGRKRRRRWPAGQRSENDRVLELVEDHEDTSS
jgi:hypothetical protein